MLHKASAILREGRCKSSLPEQHEIVLRVEALFTLADQLEARSAKAKAHVDRLTQSVLAKAFRGELVPQNPNDESAALLLERIKTQRAANKPSLRTVTRQPKRANHDSPLRKSPGRPKRAVYEPAPTKAIPIAAEAPAVYTGGIPARILAAMAPGRDYSRADLLAATGISDSEWTWVIRQLKEERKVKQTGEKRGARYSKKS